MSEMKQLYFKTRDEWRNWLDENHSFSRGIWFVYYKKHTGKPSVPYNDAVEEALCFGWIDSLVKKLDENRYCQKYTPRSDKSGWSELNKQRVQDLIARGLMTDAGMSKIKAAKKSGQWNKKLDGHQKLDMSEVFKAALNANERARKNFERLSPSYKRQYVGWIASAKRPETRERRILEALSLLEKNQKLGMK